MRKIICFCGVLLSFVMLESHAKEVRIPLEELFLRAEEFGLQLSPYRTAIKEAESQLKAVGSERLPALQLAASVGYNGNGTITDRDFSNGFQVDIPHFGNSFSVEVAQVIYAGGAISRSIEMADLGQQMAELRYEKKRQELRLLVAGIYLDMCKMRNQIEIYDQHILLTKQLIATISAKCTEGLALQNDITRYELQLEQVKLQRLRIEDALTILNLRLVRAVGLDDTVTIITDADTATRLTTEATQTEAAWQAQATAQSLDLKQLSMAEQLALQREKLTRSANYPTVSLIAQNHLTGPITMEIPAINKNFNYWFVGVGVSFKLDGLYKNRHRVRSAQIATKKVHEERAIAEEELQIQVRQAITALNEAETEWRIRQKALQLAVANYEVVDNRYRNDLALLTDMLDASTERLAAELELANAHIAFIYRRLHLDYVCGTL